MPSYLKWQIKMEKLRLSQIMPRRHVARRESMFGVQDDSNAAWSLFHIDTLLSPALIQPTEVEREA